MYSVYAIKSEKDGRIYVGLSADVDRRLKEHNNKQVFSTKGFVPWKIIYIESGFKTLLKARIREKYLKSGSGKELLKHTSPVAQR